MLIQGFCLFFTSISNIFELIVFRSENTISPFSKVLLRAVVDTCLIQTHFPCRHCR